MEKILIGLCDFCRFGFTRYLCNKLIIINPSLVLHSFVFNITLSHEWFRKLFFQKYTQRAIFYLMRIQIHIWHRDYVPYKKR